MDQKKAWFLKKLYSSAPFGFQALKLPKAGIAGLSSTQLISPFDCQFVGMSMLKALVPMP